MKILTNTYTLFRFEKEKNMHEKIIKFTAEIFARMRTMSLAVLRKWFRVLLIRYLWIPARQ